ncbi:hypothetical protein [Imhoffiella purpurea]|uniref:Uncharacterized protein n=1 Tax=Imhoffiella purpurea TaxID=1249627 RepID=W9W3Q7_9GAMM|nr:hypothetical protein [Imhoffiella purpurea]EXJ17195.1 hypothetical protein D779_0022 [Imhoffiella purpurea]
MKLLLRTALGSLIPIAAANAIGLGDSTLEETCKAYGQEHYESGYANGLKAGEAIGWNAGWTGAIEACVDDPLSYGVSLASCIPEATYGETEPNDSLITADKLTPEISFWGQNYSSADQDWYYVTSASANQNLTVSFAVPESVAGADLSAGNPGVWNLSIRDAAGNVFANFNTDVIGALSADANAVTYTATLGLVGTYYILVKPIDNLTTNQYTYNITAFLQDSALDSGQPVVGFYDSEIEPNDLPSASNPLATGVAMYGLINLTFNGVVTDPDDETTEVWGQGENDWYVYYTDGNEMVTLSFCAREGCGVGDWNVQIFDKASADAWESLTNAGISTTGLTPLLSINTDTADNKQITYNLGLKDPGYYFMKVNHKRLLTAPCNEYRYVNDSGSFTDNVCSCDSADLAAGISATGNSCYIPTDRCSDSDFSLLCRNVTEDCSFGSDPGCLYNTNSPPGCVTTKPNKDADEEVCSTYVTQARCACYSYGGVVQIPENVRTSPYNFTWYGTKLPTNTIDTDAYEDYLNRSSPY